ncbi:hypothetical protein B0T18DRAFT_12450 [Schizothecium vesticola]|uniref:Uncharacterized protein n=1 Tax=Schizothecium vesticola TaxID=314040 RepID=A0AA40F940_9PEZI|nr:hypothetical protein B0T18DRAFT_12450 [Schizothecium vesticola]
MLPSSLTLIMRMPEVTLPVCLVPLTQPPLLPSARGCLASSGQVPASRQRQRHLVLRSSVKGKGEKKLLSATNMRFIFTCTLRP